MRSETIPHVFAPSLMPERDADADRASDVLLSRFAHEVSGMASEETLKDLLEAFRAEAREHGKASAPARLPTWAITTLASLILWCAGTFYTNGQQVSALQAQVAALQASHPETISSLSTKIDSIDEQLKELNRRFNAMADQHQHPPVP